MPINGSIIIIVMWKAHTFPDLTNIFLEILSNFLHLSFV